MKNLVITNLNLVQIVLWYNSNNCNVITTREFLSSTVITTIKFGYKIKTKKKTNVFGSSNNYELTVSLVCVSVLLYFSTT